MTPNLLSCWVYWSNSFSYVCCCCDCLVLLATLSTVDLQSLPHSSCFYCSRCTFVLCLVSLHVLRNLVTLNAIIKTGLVSLAKVVSTGDY